MGFMGHCVEGNHYPRDLVYPGFGGGSLKQASVEHDIHGPVAPLIDGVAFRVIQQSEDLLYSKRAQELGPYGTDELVAAIGEEPARSLKIRNNMQHERLADCVGGVVAGWDEDGILRVAVHEDDQELVAVIWREWSHNVNRQRVPRALRLDSANHLLAVAVVGAQLTLGTALTGLLAEAAAGLVCIPITEEFPQLAATKVGGGMKLTGNPTGFVLIVQHTDL